MNKTIATLFIAAAGFSASVSALAENLDNPAFPAVQGVPVSRAQVQAELAQYQRQLASNPAVAEDAEPALAASGAPVSRAQVEAELRAYQQTLASRPARAEDDARL